MSIATTATKSLDMLAAALHGLDTIAELARVGYVSSRGTNRAIEILGLIGTVVDRLKDGFDGKLDAKTIHDNFLELRTNLLMNDAAADSELDKKFPR